MKEDITDKEYGVISGRRPLIMVFPMIVPLLILLKKTLMKSKLSHLSIKNFALQTH
jgi:hypothetical protein